MSSPDYKFISKLEFGKFLEQTKEFSFGEALYSVMRKISKPEGTCAGWIKDITDEQWYQAIEKATKEEKEYSEYKHIYDVYSDTLKEESTEYDSLRLKILEKDKEDIDKQHESKEKISMLEDILCKVYKINLLQSDLLKIAERILYIREAAMRTGEDLELSEEETKFMDNLSANSSTSYVVAGEKLETKVSGLEDIIRKKVSEDKDRLYIFLDGLRKSENV